MATSILTLLVVISLAEVFGQQAPLDFTQNYHIQTDLGNNRLFRFQTKTGQYRKEQLNPDGSVEGTYGWVDPNGILRLFEYVADNAGYRIEKETLYQLGAPSAGASIAVRGGQLNLGFEVYPLDGDAAAANRQASGGPALRINVPDGEFHTSSPYQVSSLTNTNHHLDPNPLTKHEGATFFSGAPAPPPPPPKVVVGARGPPPTPEPEQTFVVGHTGKSRNPAPRQPEPPTFVIGLSHNDEVSAPRRTPQTRPAPRPQTRPSQAQPRNFIVIGSSRRRRFAFAGY